MQYLSFYLVLRAFTKGVIYLCNLPQRNLYIFSYSPPVQIFMLRVSCFQYASLPAPPRPSYRDVFFRRECLNHKSITFIISFLYLLSLCSALLSLFCLTLSVLSYSLFCLFSFCSVSISIYLPIYLSI